MSLALAAPGAPEPTLSDETRRIVGALIEADGRDPAAAAEERAAIEREIAEVVRHFRPGRPRYRSAARLHAFVQRHYLHTYDLQADAVGAIVRERRYNCLSATMFEALAALELGYAPEVVEYPGHVRLRLHAGSWNVEIETTARLGFDVAPPPEPPTALRWPPAAPPPERAYQPLGAVPLSAAVGFAWINAAWRALDQGEVAGVAPRVEQARRVMPDLGKRNDGLRDLLGAAFVRAYEGARFDDAYALAALETSLFPTFTTPRDRLLAAASKRVETICERGEPAAAAAVLEAAAATSSQPSDLVRLERAVTPIIVAAAVVAEDWPLAQRMAERFAGAEPDRVQGARLIAWVQTRRGVDPVPRADPACPDPLARAAFPPLTSRP